MAIYRDTALGLHDAYRNVNDSASSPLPFIGRGWPGMAWTWRGCILQYVQNRSGGALTEGMGTSLYYGAAGRIGNLTGASTKSRIVTDDTFSAAGALVGAIEWPSYVFSTVGTTIGERREIFGNSAAAGASTIDVTPDRFNREAGPVHGLSTLDVNAYATAPDATTDYSVFCPWEVVATDIDALVTSRLQGVVLSTSISDGNFGVIQITGPAIASVDGTTDLVAGDALIPSSTAGVLAKLVITDANAVTIASEIFNAYLSSTVVLDAYTTNSADRRHVLLSGRHAVYPHPITIS